MSRKKESRFPVAGKRLAIARKLYGNLSRSALLDVGEFGEIVGVFNESTIGTWEKNGVPESRLSGLADFFRVPAHVFTDPDIKDSVFRKIVEVKRADPEADISSILQDMNPVPGEKGGRQRRQEIDGCADFLSWLTVVPDARRPAGDMAAVSREDILRVFEEQIRFYFAYPERYGQIFSFPDVAQRHVDLLVSFPESQKKVGIIIISPEEFESGDMAPYLTDRVGKTSGMDFYCLLVFAFAPSRAADILYQEAAGSLIARTTAMRPVSARDTRRIYLGFKEGKKNPFKQLYPYTELDTEIFHGRKKDLDILTRQLTDSPANVIFGESGVGKTSLIRAGLSSRLSGHPQRPVVIIRRIGELLELMRTPENFDLLIQWRNIHTPNAPQDDLVAFLQQVSNLNSRPVHLLIDQFEEIFNPVNAREKENFFSNVVARLQHQHRIYFSIVIRADYFYEMSDYRELHPGLWLNAYRLNRLDKGQVATVIERAVYSSGMAISDELAAAIVEDFEEDRPFLPYMQIVGYKLFERARNTGEKKITTSLYADLGGVHGILDGYFNDIFNKLNAEDNRMIEILLPSLICDGYRQVIRTDELKMLYPNSRDYERVMRLLRSMIESRLIMRTDDGGGYILTHDIVADRLMERTNKYAELSQILHKFHNRERIRVSAATARYMIKSAFRHHFPALFWEEIFVKEKGAADFESYLMDLIRVPDPDVRLNALHRLSTLPLAAPDSYENRWKVLGSLIEDEDEIEKIRAWAIRAAGALNRPAVVKTVTNALIESRRESICVAAVEALARIGTEAAFNNLVNCLKIIDKPVSVLQAVVDGVVKSGVAVKKATMLLDEQLAAGFYRKETIDLLIYAAQAFSEWPVPEATDFALAVTGNLGADLEERPQVDAGKLYRIVKKAGKRDMAGSLMSTLLGLTEKKARDELCDAIGYLCEKNILDVLIDNLNHENWFVRGNCLGCIRRIKRLDLLERLVDSNENISKGTEGRSVQAHVARLIADFRVASSKESDMAEFLSHPELEIGNEAFRLLAESKSPRMAGLLKKHLSSLRGKITSLLKKLPHRITQLPIKENWNSWYDDNNSASVFENGQQMIFFWTCKRMELFDLSHNLLSRISKIQGLFLPPLEIMPEYAAVSDETLQIFRKCQSLYESMNTNFEKQTSDDLSGPIGEKPLMQLNEVSAVVPGYQELLDTVCRIDMEKDHNAELSRFLNNLTRDLTEFLSETPRIISALRDWELILDIATLTTAYHKRREYYIDHIASANLPRLEDILIPLMGEYCSNTDARHQILVVRHLSGSKSRKVARALLKEAQKTTSPEFLYRLIETVGAMDFPEHDDEIEKFISSPHAGVRECVLDVMVRRNPEKAVALSLKLLDDPAEEVVKKALGVLSAHGTESCIDTLVRVREQSSESVRAVAYDTLLRIIQRTLTKKNQAEPDSPLPDALTVDRDRVRPSFSS